MKTYTIEIGQETENVVFELVRQYAKSSGLNCIDSKFIIERAIRDGLCSSINFFRINVDVPKEISK